MKKILLIVFVTILAKFGYAQYPVQQYLGSDSSLVNPRGALKSRLVVYGFTDTTQANTQRISQYAGALIYTTVLDKVWYRNSTATGWIEFTSSGGSTVNIYNSDGDLTGERQLGGNGYNLRFNDIREFGIGTDSLSVVLNYPKYKITGLSQTTDTTTYKPLAIDADGYFTIMDRWPGGGGSTPTLQQVLTAGSTLTQNNTIEGGTYNLKFNANNIWDVDSARQWRLRSFRASDSSIQIIQSSLYGASTLKRINISSQDTDYVSTIIIDHDHLTSEVYTRNPSTLKTGFYQAEGGFSFNNVNGDMIYIDAVTEKVGILTIGIPDSTLHVVGGLKFVTGRQGAGKVLTSDANGGADWATPSGGSYTFTNGLTNSSGTVKLGGTLTEGTTTLDGGTTNTLRFQDMLFEVTSSNTIMLGDSISLTGGATPNRLSDIKLKNDTIKINPGIGLLYIDTLTSAVGTKALRYNPTTGLVSYADTTTGGSGGTPAGSTKQIQYNNAGSFGGAAGFEYQSGSSPNVTITGQNAAHVPLYVKGIGSTQTADLFRVMRYDDSAMFRVAANGSVTIGPAYDYANAIHAPGHEFRYSNAGYTGGIKIRNHNSGSIVRLQTVNNGLYLTDDGGSAAAMTLGTRTNPADASTFIAASGSWTISAGKFGVGGAATSTVHSQGSFATAYTATATGITLGITHSVVNVTATGQTITLPAAAGITGRQYTIKLTASGSCTIDGNASETIDGATTYSLASQYKYVTIVSDGANWIVTANN